MNGLTQIHATLINNTFFTFTSKFYIKCENAAWNFVGNLKINLIEFDRFCKHKGFNNKISPKKQIPQRKKLRKIDKTRIIFDISKRGKN